MAHLHRSASSNSDSDSDTTVQQSNYKANALQQPSASVIQPTATGGTSGTNEAQAGTAIIKHAIAKGIKAQKNLLDKTSNINIKAMLDLAISRKGKLLQNLSPVFNAVLKKSTKYDKFSANL